MKKIISMALVMIVSGTVLLGCAPSSGDSLPQPDPNSNPAAGIVKAGADQEKNIKLEDVKSIELYDLEGNPLEILFTEEKYAQIVEAWNNSMIDDTSYIEMITGYTMIITLKDDSQIRMHSYGNETRVVATVKDTTYHLISPELGKILLDK